MPNRTDRKLDLALDCPTGTAYDEETFRYFLAIERARAKGSHHTLRLLMATIERAPGHPVSMPPDRAAQLFEGLRETLRETDVMGWYRQERVAGAVLSELGDQSEAGASDRIEERIRSVLRERLPAKVARSLTVRVVKVGPRRIASA